MKIYKNLVLSRLLFTDPVWVKGHIQTLSRFQYTALKLILGTNPKFDQLAAETLFRLPPLHLQLDVITIEFRNQGFLTPGYFEELYRNCELPETKTHKKPHWRFL